MTSGSRPERMMELRNNGNTKQKNKLGTKTSKYKGSQGEACLMYLKNSKQATGAGAKGQGVEDEVR